VAREKKAVVSAASDFVPVASGGLLELPFSKKKDGTSNWVRLKRLEPAEALLLLEGIPALAASEEKESNASVFWKERVPGLVKAGVVEPEFTFEQGGEPGKVSWSGLSFGDQVAIVNRLLHLNGMLAEVPAALGRFLPDEEEGRADGEGA
jgi:hypothetical protein